MFTRTTFKVGVLACSITFGALANATSNTEMDLTDVTLAAETIVAGEVLASRTEMNGKTPQTLVSVRVIDEIKGDTAETITVLLPGGSYTSGRFRIGETHAGVQRAFNNQKSIYFLSDRNASGAYQIVGFNQGVVSIESSEDGDVVQGVLTQGQVIPLDEMKEQIMSMEDSE